MTLADFSLRAMMQRAALETFLGRSFHGTSSFSRSISSSRILREENAQEEPAPVYSPPKFLIKPRHSRKYVAEKLEEAQQKQSRKWFVSFIDKETRREVKFERENRKKIEEEKRIRKEAKQERIQANQALVAEINEAYALEKRKEKDYMAYLRSQEEKDKAKIRRQLLRELIKTSSEWERHPKELAYARFRFDPFFRFAGSNFANQYATKYVYPYLKTKSSKRH